MTQQRWLDVGLPVAERAAALLAEMTLEEKVGQLVQVANPDPVRDADALASGAFGTAIVASGAFAGNVRDAGTQASAVNTLQEAALRSRLGVPLVVARDVVHGHRTVFPIPLGLAASFDEDLVRDCARAAAREASADGVRWTFAPMVDVGQDPRWGRVAEGFGEDAWLTSVLGAASVEGFQGGPGGARLADPESVAACAKHYVGYALARGGRDYAEVDVGPRTLHDRHLRPFRAAVDAGVATVMSAFHALDRVPMTAHVGLLRDHLKGDLGFAGVVVSDWDAVAELVMHRVAADLRGAAAMAVRAGVDVDMVSGAYATHLAGLVRAGDVDQEVVDDAVTRVLALKLRLGLFEQPLTDPARASAVHLAPVHRLLARRAAQSAVVVLRDDGVLPLAGTLAALAERDRAEPSPVDEALAAAGPHAAFVRRPGDPRVVHVTGPFADAAAELFGTWTLDGRAEDVVTVAAAFRERFADDPAVRVTVDRARFADETLLAARAADVVVACVGEHPLRTGEANSVASLDLPAGQVELLEALDRVAARLVVVVVTGRPLAMDRFRRLGSALVLVFHPGVEGGNGVVDVLVGDVPASGRLPAALPWTTGQVPVHHDQLPTGRPLDPAGPVGRYGDVPDGPAYPFGFGLCGAVAYGPARLSAPRLDVGGTVGVTAALTNTGERTAVETAQVYVRAGTAPVSRPVGELVGAVRVTLAPGETRDVVVELDHAALSRRDEHGRTRCDGGSFTVRVAPHAGADVGAAVLDVAPDLDLDRAAPPPGPAGGR